MVLDGLAKLGIEIQRAWSSRVYWQLSGTRRERLKIGREILFGEWSRRLAYGTVKSRAEADSE